MTATRIDALASRINDRSCVVAVIGLGYVGLPLADAFARAGVRTLGLDIDPEKVIKLEAGENYLSHLGDEFAAGLMGTGRFTPSTDFGLLVEADAVLICVPTPLSDGLEPDMSYVEQTVDAVATAIAPTAGERARIVVLESTVYPGATRESVAPALDRAGLRVGTDTLVAFSPERENPGGSVPTRAIPKLLGGLDTKATEVGAALYELAFETVVPVSSAEVAEAAKLLENVYRAVNIALVNELKGALGAMGIDVHEVVEAASSKPFGFQRFDPGPGLGGHCIPIDPFYLAWRARLAGHPSRFIELAGEINRDQPGRVVEITRALEARSVGMTDARLLVIGLAYKKNVDDVRESPALEIITRLRAAGASVDYHDPHVPTTHKMRRYDLGMHSVPLTPESVADSDAVLIVTDHDAVDYAMLGEHARLIVDTRNAMARVATPIAAIVKA